MSNVKGKGHCPSCPIRHLSIFSQLPVERLSEIQAFQPSVLTYSTGENIYHEGDVAHNAYTLRKGMVKLTKTLSNGRTQIVRLIGAGELFGFDGFIGDNHHHSAQALCPIEVCRLPFHELAQLKKQHAEIENAMMQRWIQYLREAEDMMVELGSKKAAERLASFLIRWYESGTSNEYGVLLPLSRGEIGELLGLTIETVSRFLSEWKRQGLISEQKGHFKISNINELRKTVCSSGSC